MKQKKSRYDFLFLRTELVIQNGYHSWWIWTAQVKRSLLWHHVPRRYQQHMRMNTFVFFLNFVAWRSSPALWLICQIPLCAGGAAVQVQQTFCPLPLPCSKVRFMDGLGPGGGACTFNGTLLGPCGGPGVDSHGSSRSQLVCSYHHVMWVTFSRSVLCLWGTGTHRFLWFQMLLHSSVLATEFNVLLLSKK
jgi:hypothetical protein